MLARFSTGGGNNNTLVVTRDELEAGIQESLSTGGGDTLGIAVVKTFEGKQYSGTVVCCRQGDDGERWNTVRTFCCLVFYAASLSITFPHSLL